MNLIESFGACLIFAILFAGIIGAPAAVIPIALLLLALSLSDLL